MSWERKPLEEVADFTLGKMLDQNKNKGEPLPYLANINVRWGEFDLNDLRQMRFEPHEMDRYGLEYGDIVMCEGGEPGRCAIWKSQSSGMMIQKALHRIRPYDCLDNQFLYYSFLNIGKAGKFSPFFTGSTIKHLPRQQLAKVEIEIPPIPTQKRIADILSSYDNLIENNRRRIQLLEESARLLYKEWFVQLRFPGHEHVKITDGVPEGWKKGVYDDFFMFQGGHSFKSKDYVENGRYGVVTIKNVHDGKFVSECQSRLDDYPQNMKKYCLLNSGDVLMSLTGNVGRVCVVDGVNYLLNQRVAKIIGKYNIPRSFVYWTFSNPKFQKYSQNLAHGVAQLNLSPVKLGSSGFLFPTENLVREFSDFAEIVFKQIVQLNQFNRELERARDILLPRLMNGELAV